MLELKNVHMGHTMKHGDREDVGDANILQSNDSLSYTLYVWGYTNLILISEGITISLVAKRRIYQGCYLKFDIMITKA